MASKLNSAGGLVRQRGAAARDKLVDAAGGPARAKVVLLLAGVLGLNGADQATISATANNLEQAFGIGNTAIGLLVSVVAVTGALFTLPVGVLTDRTRRVRLLAVSVATWGVAIAFAGAAQSFAWLMISRAALGAVAATAGPTVASLTGDYFPASDRGRIYGLILGGDLVGTGFGFVVSGDISTALSWRYAIAWLALPSLALAWAVWKLPEPARGGQSHLPVGAGQTGGEGTRPGFGPGEQEVGGTQDDRGLAAKAVSAAHVPPQPELVLHSDPTRRSLWWAVDYVLKVRTNLIVIVASALGYFFFAGLRSFAILYATGHYGLSKPTADALMIVVGAGALVGVFTGGRVCDRLLHRGHIRARIIVPGVCLLALIPVLAPAIITTSVAFAVPLLTLGAFLLGAPNPPLDAARLDIIHPRLWGRAEGVRTALRTLGEAGAPLLFGYVSQYVFGGPGSGTGETTSHSSVTGLEYTFLIFLIPLLVAGLLTLPALRSYPRDVATAIASQQATAKTGDDGGVSPSQQPA